MADVFPPEKNYISIGEACDILHTTASQLRFWEKEFEEYISVKRNARGARMYTEGDIRKLQLIQHLLKEKGLTIPGAKQRLYNQPRKENQRHEVVRELKTIRKFLVELRDQLTDPDKEKEQ